MKRWKISAWQRADDPDPQHSVYVDLLDSIALMTKTLADMGYEVIKVEAMK